MSESIESEVTKDVWSEYTPKTDEEIKTLAIDLQAGKIYTDRHVKNPSELGMVFMAIALGALSGWTEEDIKKLGLVYEYISEAGPRGVNGHPCFMSHRILSIEDAEKVFTKAREIDDLLKKL